jgi:hypothetical protein
MGESGYRIVFCYPKTSTCYRMYGNWNDFWKQARELNYESP